MKNNDAVFFEKLYLGLGIEYYTIANLFLLGYEAYKMPADFGFDVIASNQMARSFKNVCDKETKLLQIKSRTICAEDYIVVNTPSGNRMCVDKEFYIQRSAFEKISKEPTAYIVFYFVEKQSDQFTIPCYFWLSSHHLKFFREQGFIREKDDRNYYLKIQLRTNAKLNEQVQKVITEEGICDELKKIIKKSDITNLNSQPYVSLYRVAKNCSEHEVTRPLLNWNLYNLKFLSNEIILQEIDGHFQ